VAAGRSNVKPEQRTARRPGQEPPDTGARSTRTSGPEGSAGYPRSTGSSRGEARRQALLELVTEDLVANGLVDFSLRRAARAAGTTHKVLLYHFEGTVDLLSQALRELRARRIATGQVAMSALDGSSFGSRVRGIWPALAEQEETDVLDQAIGLAMYDPRYADLALETSGQYMPALVAICPAEWADRRKTEVAELIFATFRGLLLDRRTGSSPTSIHAALDALERALDREAAAPV
jgi:AcrR family transcriptional regulator